jgi:hypothetical protein
MFMTRSRTAQGTSVPRSAALCSRSTNYFQYFDWQWARSVNGTNHSWFGGLRPLFTLLFTGARPVRRLDALEARPHELRLRGAAVRHAAPFGLVFYLNFKYGYSSPA